MRGLSWWEPTAVLGASLIAFGFFIATGSAGLLFFSGFTLGASFVMFAVRQLRG